MRVMPQTDQVSTFSASLWLRCERRRRFNMRQDPEETRVGERVNQERALREAARA
jgi:hypothetical protein